MGATALTESYVRADTSEPVLELTCGDLLREAARDAPGQLALVEVAPPGAPSLTGADRTDRTWTYAELLAEAESCARRLLERYEPGERVVVWAPNVPEWVILQYGCALAGLVLVTANPALRAAELRYVLEQSRASGLFHADAFRGTGMSAIAAEAAAGLPLLRERFCFADWQSEFPPPAASGHVQQRRVRYQIPDMSEMDGAPASSRAVRDVRRGEATQIPPAPDESGHGRQRHVGYQIPDMSEMDGAAASLRALPEVRPGDAAQIQYTSGTTGFPKGALLHHRGIVTNSRYIWLRGEGRQRGAILTAMPLFHTGGCAMAVLGCANLRATLVLLQLFDPELMLGAIDRHRPDVVTGVPTMLLALLEHPRFADIDTSSVRVVMSGGATVPSELVMRVERELDCRFTTVYGQTELSPVVTQTSPSDEPRDRAETSGRPLWNVEVKLVDLAGEVVPVGEQGEICARGYQEMLEYFDLPEKTAETIDADGWLHTGDLGRIDARGYLEVTGRLKDMIIRGGENIYPAEIEQALFAQPQVADVAVVGVPDPLWGERVAAVVRAADPAAPPSAAELHAYCREHLAPHKTPVDWYLAEEFPLTGSGKVRKFEVQERIAAGGYARLE